MAEVAQKRPAPLFQQEWQVVVSKREIARSFGSKSQTYISKAAVQNQIAQKLIAISSPHIQHCSKGADFGAGPSVIRQIIRDEQPQLSLLDIDIAEQSLRSSGELSICADFDNLPLRESVFDVVFSSSALQWSSNALTAVVNIMKTVRSGGIGCFALFTEGTLDSLKKAQADAGIESPVHYWDDTETEQFLRENSEDFSLVSKEEETFSQVFSSVDTALRSVTDIGASPQSLSLLKNSVVRNIVSSYTLRSKTADNQFQNRYNVLFLLLEKR